ncbi:MAG: lysylphosphatidylglycerol synthase domain-containing protein [Myxococcota bacterium]
MSDSGEGRPAITPKVVAKAIGQLLLGLGLFAALVYWVSPSWEDIEDRLDVQVPWLLVSVFGSFIATVVTAARWKLLSETMGGSRLPYGVYFHYLALTRVVGQFLPTVIVDVFGRTAALKAAGSDSRMGQLIAPVLLERLLDLLLPLVLLGWAVAVHWGPAWVQPWTSLAVLVLAFVALGIPLLRPLVRVALLLYGWLRRLRKRDRGLALPEMPEVSTALATRIVSFSVVRYAGILVQYLGAGAGLGVLLAPLVLVSAAPLAQLAGLVGITPGGLGLQEGGWVAALERLGEDEASIVVFMAGTRLMMSVNFGLLSLASWPWRRDRRASAAA